MKIIFRIRDWKTSSKTPHAIQAVALPLIPVDKTIEYLDKIVRSIRKHTDVPESRLPQCTHRVRGIDAPVYKYFSKPTNKRATNVFLNRADAVKHMQTVTKGDLRTVYGDPKNCKYCAGKSLCNT